jgi:hypothetical protein
MPTLIAPINLILKLYNIFCFFALSQVQRLALSRMTAVVQTDTTVHPSSLVNEDCPICYAEINLELLFKTIFAYLLLTIK